MSMAMAMALTTVYLLGYVIVFLHRTNRLQSCHLPTAKYGTWQPEFLFDAFMLGIEN